MTCLTEAEAAQFPSQIPRTLMRSVPYRERPEIRKPSNDIDCGVVQFAANCSEAIGKEMLHEISVLISVQNMTCSNCHVSIARAQETVMALDFYEDGTGTQLFWRVTS